MKKFKVLVREVLYHDYVYEVEAANEEEAENRYFDKGVCVKETENGKEESDGEEVEKVEEIK